MDGSDTSAKLAILGILGTKTSRTEQKNTRVKSIIQVSAFPGKKQLKEILKYINSFVRLLKRKSGFYRAQERSA